jgi:putative transposon-encoded protein
MEFFPTFDVMAREAFEREVSPYGEGAHVIVPKRHMGRTAVIHVLVDEQSVQKLPWIKRPEPEVITLGSRKKRRARVFVGEVHQREVKRFGNGAHIPMPKRYLGRRVVVVIPDIEATRREWARKAKHLPWWKGRGYRIEEVKTL